MKKKALSAILGTACTLFLLEPQSIGQDPSGNLNVSGTATINALDVTGNTLYFGTSGSNSALSITYDDAGDSSITQQSTRPSTIWNWQRLTASGNAMQLDASNRLILTGTATTNPPQLILDPNGAITINGSNFLTQTNADSLYLTPTAANLLYLSSTIGLSASNGNIGIGGTASPTAALQILKSGMQLRLGSSPSKVADFGVDGLGNLTVTTSTTAKTIINGSLDVNGPFNLSVGNGSASVLARYFVSGNYSNALVAEVGNASGLCNTAIILGRRFDGGVISSLNSGIGMLFQIENSDKVPQNTSRIRSILSGTGSLVSADLLFDTSSYNSLTEKMRITASGKIGIGTTTPSEKLDVSGNAKISGTLAISGTGALVLPDGTVLSGSNALKNALTSGTDGNNLLTQNTANTLYLTPVTANSLYLSSTAGLSASNGNIGIGTTTPTAKLDVHGSVSFGSGALTLSDTGVFTQYLTMNNGASVSTRIGGRSDGFSEFSNNISQYDVLDDPSQSAWKFTMGGAYNSFGIQTNPPGTDYASNYYWVLQIQNDGSINFAKGAAGISNTGVFCGDGSGLYNVSSDTLTGTLTVVSGNVGIGTSEPQATLDVQGNANFTGPIRVAPQGDLDMGQFTTEPTQAQQQSMQQNLPTKQTLQSVSGTSGVMTSGTTLFR